MKLFFNHAIVETSLDVYAFLEHWSRLPGSIYEAGWLARRFKAIRVYLIAFQIKYDASNTKKMKNEENT